MAINGSSGETAMYVVEKLKAAGVGVSSRKVQSGWHMITPKGFVG